MANKKTVNAFERVLASKRLSPQTKNHLIVRYFEAKSAKVSAIRLEREFEVNGKPAKLVIDRRVE